jgi:peroxiredoxin Q/BCP
MQLDIDTQAPDFSISTEDGKNITLSSFKSKKVVLYFYPKDDTPGCTRESCDFNAALVDFSRINAEVIGISRDSLASHKKFKEKYGLTFPLVSDEDGKICMAYGVWVEKKNYGKSYMGIERSTFLINENGLIQKVWRKVKVDNHVSKVLEAIANLP